jgi:hypothetical protein
MEGRFISKDPIAIGGNIYTQGVNVSFFQYVSAVSNSFAYTDNNPVNFIDPSGLIWVTRNTDHKGWKNTKRWLLNRVTVIVGSGDDPSVAGASPEEYVGWERVTTQVWENDPDNPCRDKEYPIGARRIIEQTRKKFINPGPKEALINDPDAPFYYQWSPPVNSPTYDEIDGAKYYGIYRINLFGR